MVGKHKKLEDIARSLPPRLRLEPKPGDNPLRRPYPQHSRDMKTLERLMEEMDDDRSQDYEFTKRDLRVPITPRGVLFFHALDIQNLVLSKNNFEIGSPFCIYVEIECQDTIKCSDPVYGVDFHKVRIDHAIHLSIELSEIRFDEMNDFLIHIYAFQDPETHYLIGSKVIHLYEFVREIHGISSMKIFNELSFQVGILTYEFAWAYGAFGYGFSSQLRNTKNGIFESVCHSLFPRIKLKASDLVDNSVNCRVPKRLRLVTLNSFLVRKAYKNTFKEGGKIALQKKAKSKKKLKGKGNEKQDDSSDWEDEGPSFEAKAMVFRRVKFVRGTPIHLFLNLDIHQRFMEDDFNIAYGEYICLRNRRERLSWLTRLVDGRLKDTKEYEIDHIFYPFKDVRDAKRCLTVKRPLGCPPAYLEYTDPNRKRDCRPIHPANVEAEDLKFIKEKLGSAPRFPGYLNYVFGYEKPPPAEEQLKDFEYHVDPRLKKGMQKKKKDTRGCFEKGRTCCSEGFFKLGVWILWIWEFIFPSFATKFKEQELLPELSLTMPSPQHSTTDFHSFCTQKQVFDQETDQNKARRRATRFLEMSRNTRKPDFDVEDFEDFIIPSRPFVGENSDEREIIQGERRRHDPSLLHKKD